MKSKRTWVLAAAGAAIMLAACDAAPADGSGASVVEESEPVADEAAEAETDEEAEPDEADEGETDREAEVDEADEAALGTRDNPLAIGTRIEMGDWTLTVTDVTVDAAEQVMAENQFNDPPEEGHQFVMFNVDATYEGEESGTAWLDFSWAIVGSEGNTFSDRCGVIPDSLNDTGETFPGGSVSGNVCFSAASDQIEGGTLRIEELFSFDDTRAFYALD